MKRLAFGLGFALFVLGAAEIVLRLLLGAPSQPFGHVAPALTVHDVWFTETEGEVVATYQEVLLPPERFDVQARRPRVAFLGGSSVHGGTGKVRAEMEFPALVGRSLGVEALNLGLPGLESKDHVAILEALLAYEVDTVVAYCCHNDFGNLYFRKAYGDWWSGTSARVAAVLDGLMLSHLVRRLTGRLVGTGAEASPSASWPSASDRAEALEGLEANLERLADLAEGAGVDLVLVTPVSAIMLPPAQTTCASDPCAAEGYEQAKILHETDIEAATAAYRAVRDADEIPVRAPTAAQQVVRDVAARRGLALVDAERDLPRAGELDTPSGRLFEDLVHLNAQGHHELSTLIVEVLRSKRANGAP